MTAPATNRTVSPIVNETGIIYRAPGSAVSVPVAYEVELAATVTYEVELAATVDYEVNL